MAEYIDRQAAIDALGEEPENWIDAEFDLGTQDQWRWDVKAIKAVPPADVRPVVRGRWIDEHIYKQTMSGKTYDGFTWCSNCKHDFRFGYRSKFCPNCGADMRGGDAE